ncbi:hypothetical protein ScPMuIL_002498 [Solemya velum]
MNDISRTEYEIITDCSRCRQIMHRLQYQPIVALAGEGVRVGREGPLLLLQVGTASGTVYLFDLLRNKDLVTKGGLAKFLGDENTQKVVVNGCSALSAALYFQFAITVNNVFDTQVAHSVIERHKGRQLPVTLSLFELCHVYSNNTNKYDREFDVKLTWEMIMPDLWSQRPLNSNMINFAVNDIIAIFPEVYNSQREYIHHHDLDLEFERAVTTESLFYIDVVLAELKNEADHIRVCNVLRDFDEIPRSHDIKLDEISDEDVINALLLVPVQTAEQMSENISKLKEECILRELVQVECSICSSRETFEPESLLVTKLLDYMKHTDQEIVGRACTAYSHVRRAVLASMSRKYGESTPRYCLSGIESHTLSTLTPDEYSVYSGDPVIQHFYKTLKMT